jgi:hypothetical protein
MASISSATSTAASTVAWAIAFICIMPGPLVADVITDWDERAVALVTPKMPPPATERAMALVNTAMFDAVNSIERRYRPFLVQLPAAATTPKQAAAAAAAGTILAHLLPQAEAEVKAAMAEYLATLPNSDGKSEGIKLGEAVAAKVIAARTNDGSNAADSYRPKTRPGVYVPTQATVLPMWPQVKPFALTSGSQFRPEPPMSLQSAQWAADYNEIKEFGGATSAKRSARQSEDARFWFATGAQTLHPLARQLVAARKMSLIDSARFMALAAVAAADAYIAVMDAKYHYDFWRPITAIRNGDIDDNPATERDPMWQPLGATPMHPEYPCAHCIHSAALAAVVEAAFGTAAVPELVMTSSTAPGVTHSWTDMWAYANEVADARIWAGLHYRFSSRIGQDMGRKIGQHVVRSVMQPVGMAGSR